MFEKRVRVFCALIKFCAAGRSVSRSAPLSLVIHRESVWIN
jgi:hypothetical protein